ncbi:protein NATD1 [Nematostella vectensis]|uniref:protein NATD1 n=1 Tax=Nematostella vectensis TaxID=45351 RepID=UPI00207754A6|nr:protein NATD1 [Nematostella vectensis]
MWLSSLRAPSSLRSIYRGLRSTSSARYSIMSSYQVQHCDEAKAFFITLGNEKAILEYEKEGSDILNMWHTEVPVSHRGHGIAAHLAKAAFDFTVENNLKFRATCTYLQKYILEHPLPEYTERSLPPK